MSLAVTCLIIAAKLTQPLKPKFELINNVLKSDYEVSMKKSVFNELECNILISLQFEINFVSPILFLERFQRIFDFDREQADFRSWKVGYMARDFCSFM